MNKIKRRKTREVKIGDVIIGGNHPIAVQSMCDTDTRDVKTTVAQIKTLEEVGCEIIRVAVPDMKAAKSLSKIKQQINIPLVADIHFDYRLALESIKQGVDKLRLNPGNIGSLENIKLVVDAAKEAHLPIRIGVNSGSIEKEFLEKYGSATPQAAVDSVLKHIGILEDLDFHNIVVALKFSDVSRTIEAYRLISEKIDYPLHLGVTEAGSKFMGTIKTAVGLGILLSEGIGDTIRVSLTGETVEEVKVGYNILKSLELREYGPNIISCPICGRCEIDLLSLVKKVEAATKDIKKPITIAVMGCIVNGPGEAREADIGVAGGKDCGVIFAQGKVIKTVPEKDIVSALMEEISKLINN